MQINSNIEDEDSDEEDDDFDYEETALESYVTPLDDEDTAVDEYEVFKTVVHTIEAQNPEWYRRLTSSLTAEDGKAIQEVFKLGEQRVAARRSKSIEQAGGKSVAEHVNRQSLNICTISRLPIQPTSRSWSVQL